MVDSNAHVGTRRVRSLRPRTPKAKRRVPLHGHQALLLISVNCLEKDLGRTILIPDSFFLPTVRFSVSPTVLKRYQCQFLHSWAPRGCQAGQSRTEEQGKDGPKEEVKKIDED